MNTHPSLMKAINSFVDSLMKDAGASERQIVAVCVALGLDREGRLTKVQRKEKLATGVRLLIDLHFGRYTEIERADILGELAVNSKLFGTEAAQIACPQKSRHLSTRACSVPHDFWSLSTPPRARRTTRAAPRLLASRRMLLLTY